MVTLQELLEKFKDVRGMKLWEPEEALRLLLSLRSDDNPRLAWESRIGVQFDINGAIYFIDHDWDNEYSDMFLDEVINAIDRAITRQSISRETEPQSHSTR